LKHFISSFLQGLLNDLIKNIQGNNHFTNYPKRSEWFRYAEDEGLDFWYRHWTADYRVNEIDTFAQCGRAFSETRVRDPKN
jgi:hypothetical protein